MSSTPTRKSARGVSQSPSVGGSSFSNSSEKKELQSLNNRLQAYIFRVRDLVEKNQTLETEIQALKENSSNQDEAIKKMYERELQDTRALLDEISKEKAELQIAKDRSDSQVDEVTNINQRLLQDVQDFQNSLREIREEILEKNLHVVKLQSCLESLEKNEKSLQLELKQAKNEAQKLRTDLEAESLLRVELQNGNTSLREQLNFAQQIAAEELKKLTKELTFYKDKRVALEVDLRNQYNDRFEEALEEAREQAVREFQRTRSESEQKYISQLEDAQRRRLNDQNLIAILTEDNARLQAQFDDYRHEIKTLESKYFAYEQKSRELEGQLLTSRRKIQDAEFEKEAEIIELKKALNDKTSEYESLLSVKEALDSELDTYHKMLDTEEQRLGIQPSSSNYLSDENHWDENSSPLLQSRPLKRRRNENCLQFYQIAAGDIAISNVSIGGEHMTISNLSSERIYLGNWIISWVCGDKTASYKIPSKAKIEPMSDIKIWTNEGDYKSRAEEDLFWKHSSPWKNGGKVTVCNGEGVVVAEAEVREGPTFQFVQSQFLNGQEPNPTSCSVM